jgi:hypothetical protein
MPTYRNDGDVTYRIPDTGFAVKSIAPGESVETYDPNVPDDFTETSESPSLSKTVSGENMFTDSVNPRGQLNISVSGEFTGTVTLQRSWDDFETIKDRAEYTSSTETEIDDDDPNVKYRIGVKNDGWTTGSAVIQLRPSRVS